MKRIIRKRGIKEQRRNRAIGLREQGEAPPAHRNRPLGAGGGKEYVTAGVKCIVLLEVQPFQNMTQK